VKPGISTFPASTSERFQLTGIVEFALLTRFDTLFGHTTALFEAIRVITCFNDMAVMR
jgi:hypothetical protein